MDWKRVMEWYKHTKHLPLPKYVYRGITASDYEGDHNVADLLQGLGIAREQLKIGTVAIYTKRFYEFPISTSTSRTIATDFGKMLVQNRIVEAVGLVMQFPLNPEDIVLDTRPYETAHNAQAEIVLRPDKPYRVKLVKVEHYGGKK